VAEPADAARSEREKRAVGAAAAQLVRDGMLVGLGSGSTAAEFVRALAVRRPRARLFASSPATERLAVSLGLEVEPFAGVERVDLTVDGADQVAPTGWLVKGGGGAHTREKVLAAAADRFVVIVSSDKLVEALRPPVPLELLAYGLAATLRHVAPAALRDREPSPDGGRIADHLAPFEDPAAVAARFDATPGVVGHGLFSPELVSDVLVAEGDTVRRLAGIGGR
jgi:ribose 5-phosphate isomerase A